jgi:hypothetical protein
MLTFLIKIFVKLKNFKYGFFNVVSQDIKSFFFMSDIVCHEKKKIKIRQAQFSSWFFCDGVA